ncbi:hypothetical protein M378DRAFT_736903 [Amanita muscaria Koide BX008]|uniref:Secreted protein n=1 Tax=Amanita muscaria (strain Koide BX008) TaxID=946122 RepID=A0A0C2SIL9_AMAMK|nr:hypothetical protein M378DRAFT_736903 [Amanita muscaria Koide BX008]
MIPPGCTLSLISLLNPCFVQSSENNIQCPDEQICFQFSIKPISSSAETGLQSMMFLPFPAFWIVRMAPKVLRTVQLHTLGYVPSAFHCRLSSIACPEILA